MKRSRINRVGKRAEREAEELAAFKANPPSKCERCNCYNQRLHAHHKLPRSRGGDHTPENRAFLCFSCHSLIHDHRCTDWRKWIVHSGPNQDRAQ